MKSNNTALILAAMGLASLSGSAGAQITFNGTDGMLAGLTGVNNAGSATYSAGAWTISSPDNVGGGGVAQVNDTATVLIPNGYQGANFGTLSTLLAQGAAGNVSFDLASMTPGVNLNYYAYWDVILTDPNNSSIKINFINAFSDNKLGANPFNQGSSANTSGYVLSGTYVSLFESWSIAGALTPVGGDPSLANWYVSDLGISVGGWDSGVTETGVIDSITVPGGASGVPDGGATLGLLGMALLGISAIQRKSAQ